MPTYAPTKLAPGPAFPSAVEMRCGVWTETLGKNVVGGGDTLGWRFLRKNAMLACVQIDTAWEKAALEVFHVSWKSGPAVADAMSEIQSQGEWRRRCRCRAAFY